MTEFIKEFAELKNRKLPNPMPCPDNCGVSINWHLVSDFEKGWTSRITLFNWGEADIVDWFASIELGWAMPGFEKVYSMDGKVLPYPDNGTLFLQGLSGLNYLIAERNGSNPRKDPPVPGSQQTVISFTKKQTPSINVAGGDGFPTKVYFNGEECSLPTIIPSYGRREIAASEVLVNEPKTKDKDEIRESIPDISDQPSTSGVKEGELSLRPKTGKSEVGEIMYSARAQPELLSSRYGGKISESVDDARRRGL
ncbi:COBRA-like protein 7 [Orobanche minor]